MKKRLFLITAIVLCVFFLCGAADSELLEASADSEATAVSAVCEATGGEHRYGNWIFRYDRMERICLDCRANESREIDGALLLADKLPGAWVFTGVERGSQFIEAGRLPAKGLDPYFNFAKDGSISILGADEGDEFTWEFSSCEKPEGDEVRRYYFKVLRNGEDYAELCMHGSDSQRFLVLEKDGERCILRRDPNHLAVAGCWGCNEEGDYVLQLDDDHRFVGYFDQEPVSGWWQLRPAYGDDESLTLPLLLSFGEKGEERSILALAEGLDPEINILVQTFFMVFELDDGNKDLSFISRSSDYYAEVEKALAISGKWISSNVDYFNWYSDERYSIPTTDYSISLGEGNSVHAVLMDGEITGTWELSEVDTDMGYATSFYDVFTGSSSAAFYFQVLDGTVHLHVDDYSYTMGQMDEEGLAEFEKSIEMHSSAPLGQWPSVSVRTIDFSSYIATSTVERSSDYSITFSEDGTVYALLDREYTGTWEPLRINRHSDDQIQYSYDLHFDGVGEEPSIYCYLDAENGGKGELSVSIQTQEPSMETTYCFRQMDEAYLDRLAAMVGYWQPVEAQWYNDATQEVEAQEIDENMFFEAFEDGSFRANFPSYFTGTWLYSGLDQYDNAMYSISSDDGRSQLYYIFGDTLRGWLENAGKTISVYFEKSEAPEGMENNEAAESAKGETANDQAAAATESGESGAELPLEEKLIGSWTAKDALVAMEEVTLDEAQYRHFTFNTDGSFEYSENSGKSFCGTWAVSEDNSLADMGIDLAAYGLDDFVSQKVLLTLDDGSTMELSLSEDDGDDRLAPLMLSLSEGDVFSGSFYYFTKD